jgi:hypothetical protein
MCEESKSAREKDEVVGLQRCEPIASSRYKEITQITQLTIPLPIFKQNI